MSEGKQLAYRVRNWDANFTKSETKRLKTLKWVAWSNNLISRNYLKMMERPDGPEVYGIWCAIVMLASHGREGEISVLADEDGPYSIHDISKMTHIPEGKIESTVNLLMSEEFKLLELVDSEGKTTVSQQSSTIVGDSQQSSTNLSLQDIHNGHNGTERDKTEQDITPAPAEGNDLISLEKEFVTEWNSLDGVVKNMGDTLSDKRRKSFRARLKDDGWDWRSAFEKFPLKSTVGNPNKWKPGMDWILKPDNLIQILEGKYDFEWNSSGGTSSGSDNPSRYHGTTDFSM